jgi:hypothetical protein
MIMIILGTLMPRMEHAILREIVRLISSLRPANNLHFNLKQYLVSFLDPRRGFMEGVTLCEEKLSIFLCSYLLGLAASLQLSLL